MIHLSAAATLMTERIQQTGRRPAFAAVEVGLTLDQYREALQEIRSELGRELSTEQGEEERAVLLNAINQIAHQLVTAAADFFTRSHQLGMVQEALEHGLTAEVYVARLRALRKPLRLALKNASSIEVRREIEEALQEHAAMISRAPEDFAIVSENSRLRRTMEEGGN